MKAAGREIYSKPFFFSLLLHLVVFIVLVASFDFNSTMPVLQNSDQNTEIINAMVMNAPSVKSNLAPIPQHVVPRHVVAKPSPPEKSPEKPVVTQIKKQAIAISDKKQNKINQDKIAQQMLQDIKKQAKHEKKIKQKALAAAFEKEMKQMTAKSIQRQLLQEQKNIAGARAQKVRGEVDKYKALILQVISQNWLVPSSVDKKLYAQLLVRVAPGGVVLEVQVIKSSGDDSLDRSARAAIFKSSPLPVPPDRDAFEPFRQFVLKVKPENILSADSWSS